MADLTYYEIGYIQDGYYETIVVSDAITLSGAFSPSFTVDIADDTGYFIPEYIETDYFESATTNAEAIITAVVSLSADADKIKNADSSLSSQIDVNASTTDSLIKGFDGALESQAQSSINNERIRTTGSNIDSAFSSSSIISHIEGADLQAFAEATMSAVAQRFRDSEAQPFTSFTIATDPTRIKGAVIDEDAIFSITALGGLNAVADATVGAAFSISASYQKFKSGEADFVATASATAQPEVYQLRARTAVSPTTNTGGNFTTASIDTTVKKFGLGSAGFTKGTRIYPTGEANENAQTGSKKITVNGSTFVIVHPGYTWTSTNGTTWTRSTNDLTEHLWEVRKTGSYFVGISRETTDRVWYSTNGTSWSYNDSLASVNNLYADPRRGITYINGAYYVFDTAVIGTAGRLTWASTTNFSSWTTNGGFAYNTRTVSPTIESYYYNESNGEFYLCVSPATNSGLGGNPIFVKGTPSSSLTSPWVTSNNENFIYAFAVNGNTIVALELVSAGTVRLKYSTNAGSSWTTGNTYNGGSTSDVRYLDGDFYFSVGDGVYKGYTSPTKVGVDLDNAVATASAIVSLSEIKEGFVHSTANNGSTWTYTNLPNTQNVPGKLEYDVTSTLEPFGTFDVWFRLQSRDTFLPQFIVRWIDDDYYVTIERDLFGKLFIRYNNGRTEETAYANRFNVAVDTWHHLRITRSGSTSSFYLNGSRQWTTTAITWPTTPFDLVGDGSNFDELYVTTDVLTSPSATSYSVPTQPYDSSSLLVHFDTDFVSSTEATFDVEADFEAFGSSSVTANPNTKNVDGSFAVSSSLSVDAVKITSVDANFTVTASLVADNTRVKQFDSDNDSAVTLTADAQAVIVLSQTLLSDFAISLTAIAQRVGDIDLFPEFTLACQDSYVRGAEATLDGFAATTATINDLVKQGTADLTAIGTLTANGGKLIDATANITDAITATIDAIYFEGTSLLAPVSATLTATATKNAIGTAPLSVTASLTATTFIAEADTPSDTLYAYDVWHFNDAADQNPYDGSELAGNFSQESSKFGADAINGPYGSGYPGYHQSQPLSNAYVPGTDGNAQFTVDFWWRDYHPNYNITEEYVDLIRNVFSPHIKFQHLRYKRTGTSNKARYRLRIDYPGYDSEDVTMDGATSNYTAVFTSGVSAGLLTDWDHIAIQLKNGYVQVYINGTYEAQLRYPDKGVSASFNASVSLWDSSPAFGAMDELRIDSRTAYYSSNFTPPTAEYPNTVNYFRTYPKNGYAVLDARSSFTTSPLLVQFGSASLSANATLAESSTRVRFGSADLNTTATVTCEFQEIDSFEADFTTTATQTATATRIKQLSATLNAVSSITALNTRLRDSTSTLEATAQAITQGDRVRLGFAETGIDAEFTTTATATRILALVSDFDSIASTLTAAVKNATGTVTLDATATLSIEAQKITDEPITIDAIATLLPITGRRRDCTATIQAQANSTATALRIQQLAASITSEFELAAENSRTRDSNATATSSASITATTSNTLRTGSNLSATATLSADYDVFVTIDATLTATASLVGALGVNRDAEAQFQAITATLTAGRVINIDEFTTLTIREETRVLKILPESRVLQVEQETRINIIKGQQL